MTCLMHAEYDLRTRMPRTTVTPAGEMDIAADDLGRLARQEVRLNGDVRRAAASTVSPGGRVLDVLHVDGSRREIGYDALGRPQTMHEGELSVTFAYDGLSRLTRRATDDGGRRLTERFAYDSMGRLAEQSIEIVHMAPMRRRLAFAWQADGKMTTRAWYEDERLLRTEHMAYDARGRLASHGVTDAAGDELPRDEAGNAYVAQAFTYDAIDNLASVRTEMPDGETDVATYTYDVWDRDRLQSVVHVRPEYGPPVVLAYDRDGNVISDGRGRTFGWDPAGRLDTVMEATGTSEYRHGPGGRICAIARDGCVTYRYHEDGALAAEVTASDDGRSIPEERRYVRAGRALVAETRLAAAIRETWLLGCDTQGTVLVESGGDAVRTRTYGAFGHRDATGDGARSGFTGTAIDSASGCYFLGDRLYSPTLRRFLNPDPISPFGGGGLNRYGYCGGDPVNRIDPTGNSWVSTFFTVLGLVGAVVGAAASIIALPGVLAAAATTPSMVMATSAVVIETVSVVAEGGSLIAQATGSEELATIFGAAALATGLASAGLGLLPKALAKSSKFMKGAAQASGSHGNAGQRSVVLGAGPSSQATPPREIARLAPDEIDMRRVEIVNGTRIVVDPIVHSVKHPGNARSLHYLMDSAVKSDGLTDGIALAIATQPRSKGKQVVYFYTGIHGNEFGMNTIGNRFATPDPTFGDTLPQADFNTVKRLQAQLGSGYKVKVRSLARVDPATYHSYLSRPGHHVHYFCFSLVDEGLVSVLNIPPDLPISIL